MVGSGQQQQQDASIDSSTPWIAASDGNIRLLQESLAKLQLPVTAADENGYTLLQAAASYSQIETMQWILSALPQPATDVNAVDHEGDSALHYASSADSCQLLLAAMIDKNIRNKDGKTALEAKREELQEMILDEDYDEDDVDATALRECINYLEQQ